MGMERSHGELGGQARPYGALQDALRWEQELGDAAIERAYRAGSRSVTVEWAELSSRVARADKPRVLVAAVSAGALSDVEFRVGLEDAWTTCEWPGRAADRGVWVEPFQMAGVDDDRYLHETTLTDRASLPEQLRVYRAAAEGHEDGLSWTTSFERADWFATRLGALSGRGHRIFEVDVPRTAVLASFDKTRGESEFIVDLEWAPGIGRREVEPAKWEYLLEQDRP